MRRQDRVTQKQEKEKKSGRPLISPQQDSILEDRRAMRKKNLERGAPGWLSG